MLRPKVVSQVLQLAAKEGEVLACLLLNLDGSLIACAAADDRDVEVYAAIASSIWGTYDGQGHVLAGEPGEQLSLALLECEEGHVAIAPAAHTLVCVVGSRSVNFGVLKAKAVALADYFAEPLERIYS